MDEDRPEPAPDGEPPALVAFDFDRTLVRRDTLLPFLWKFAGRRRVVTALAAQTRRVRTDSDAAKLDLLRRLTVGEDAERLTMLGRDYSVGLHHLLRPDTVAALRAHRRAGHRLVIVSASLGAYLRPFGETLGFDQVTAVELVSDTSGRLTGEVERGVNVRGPEKARRLDEWIKTNVGAGSSVDIWAYGDSEGDRELLAMADHPVWVGRQAIEVPRF